MKSDDGAIIQIILSYMYRVQIHYKVALGGKDDVPESAIHIASSRGASVAPSAGSFCSKVNDSDTSSPSTATMGVCAVGRWEREREQGQTQSSGSPCTTAKERLSTFRPSPPPSRPPWPAPSSPTARPYRHCSPPRRTRQGSGSAPPSTRAVARMLWYASLGVPSGTSTSSFASSAMSASGRGCWQVEVRPKGKGRMGLGAVRWTPEGDVRVLGWRPNLSW